MIRKLLEKIKKWDEEAPLRQKILTLILLCLIPLFLFYQFYYKEKKEKIELIKKDLKDLELNIQKYSPYVNKLEVLNKQITARREFLETVKNIFPDEREIPEVLKKITEVARKNGLEILVFRPEKEIEKNYYHEISIRIELVGSFKDMANFLNEVQRLPRLVVVNDVEFKRGKDKRLNAVIILNTFQYTGKSLDNKTSEKVKDR